jgi:hypothetical protein
VVNRTRRMVARCLFSILQWEGNEGSTEFWWSFFPFFCFCLVLLAWRGEIVLWRGILFVSWHRCEDYAVLCRVVYLVFFSSYFFAFVL